VFEPNIEGKGKCYFPNGEVYVGNWVNNTRQGNGIIIFDNNSTMASYQGHFENNRRFKIHTNLFHFLNKVKSGSTRNRTYNKRVVKPF